MLDIEQIDYLNKMNDVIYLTPAQTFAVLNNKNPNHHLVREILLDVKRAGKQIGCSEWVYNCVSGVIDRQKIYADCLGPHITRDYIRLYWSGKISENVKGTLAEKTMDIMFNEEETSEHYIHDLKEKLDKLRLKNKKVPG